MPQHGHVNIIVSSFGVHFQIEAHQRKESCATADRVWECVF